MTAAGIAALVLGLCLSAFLSLRYRSGVYVVLFLLHAGASLFNWQYSLVAAADAYGYYAYELEGTSFSPGTWIVGLVGSTIREQFDATYVDAFMYFHLFGYLGLVLMVNLCRDAWLQSGLGNRYLRGIVWSLPFLPGLHVWTSSVGKDSPMFLGIMLFVWGSYRPTERFWSLASGIAISSLIRPHVGAFMVVSCILVLIISRDIPVRWRVTTLAVLATVSLATLPYLQEYVGLETVDSNSLSSYVELRQSYNLSGGSSVDISEYPFPLQFFTYMYRPLFVDARSVLAALVSIENAMYLTMTLMWGAQAFRQLWSGSQGFFFRFNSVYWFMAVSVFAATTPNLGIAVRQKVMVIPSLLCALLSARWYTLVTSNDLEQEGLPGEADSRAIKAVAARA